MAYRLYGGVRAPTYSYARPAILDLLSAEAVDPLETAAACEDAPEERYRILALHLRADLSLRAMWLVGRLQAG